MLVKGMSLIIEKEEKDMIKKITITIILCEKVTLPEN